MRTCSSRQSALLTRAIAPGLVLLIVGVFPHPASAIRNGTPEARVQHNGVGTILPSPGHSRCTGVMVSRFVVLTAAQCFRDFSPDPAYDFSLAPKMTARAKIIRPHPQFLGVDGLNIAFDVALATLDKAEVRRWRGISLTANREIQTPVGVLATGVGFGETQDGVGSGARTSGIFLINRYAPGADSFGGPIPDAFLEVIAGNAQNHMICSGDTGGPLILQDSVAGVASFRYVATCGEEGPGYYVNLYPHAEWIRDNLNDLDPPGACQENDNAAFATGEGGCKELATGRVWSRVAARKMTQPNATADCYFLEEGGRSDWRLPTAGELSALDSHAPATQVHPPGRAWSSTSGTENPDAAFFFAFGSHTSREGDRSKSKGVICVR